MEKYKKKTYQGAVYKENQEKKKSTIIENMVLEDGDCYNREVLYMDG